MKNNRNKDYEWTLTVVRDGRQGLVKNADAADFKFGRWRKDLDKSNIKNIPDGLVPKKTSPLTLPGPPDFRYHFFGD